ncbi:MAG: alpha/beta hydrolase [Burkholderiaceae bacterium]
MKVRRDLSYGPHPRQVADVFEPGVADAPIVVFVHGGAFVRGSKRTTDEIHDNVLYWFARQGFVGVNLEYRLAPETRYPGGALDVAAALDWVSANATRFGGDASRILLVGHSAGGTHVAGYVFDPRVGRFGQGVRATVLISARLRADVLPGNPNRDGVAAYFGSDPVEIERASPIHYADRSRVPTMVVTAQFENPLLDVYGADFAARLQAARHPLAPHRIAQGTTTCRWSPISIPAKSGSAGRSSISSTRRTRFTVLAERGMSAPCKRRAPAVAATGSLRSCARSWRRVRTPATLRKTIQRSRSTRCSSTRPFASGSRRSAC